ncbi:DNA methylase [Mycoplasmopsis canis]|uniref:16S rRNA (guanine(966)-N(2))-methyltransferase RsmD n=1 Tax=Mycoplasmopsis canis TaxID=29555 RepID=UPI00062455F1|nr:16S rRNA (guanine(966)-N(2))-methyltransferase RsmD [Mycoplasmopsis canis]AKF40944.1 DNA methylase [Mycoplasmopsis canis]
MLRIISGIYRNRKIQEPDLKITRPTTDKVREAIFSSLQFKIQGKKVLDLFSGSGALSIEAVSRGASDAYSIEKNREVFKVLSKNISSLNITNINTINIDALAFLDKTSDCFDFIFIDAPYNEYELVNQSLDKIFNKNMLLEDGEIILETNDPSKIIIPSGFKIYKEKRYGRIDVLYICKDE